MIGGRLRFWTGVGATLLLLMSLPAWPVSIAPETEQTVDVRDPAERPSLADWEQWQPELDQSDIRLPHAVSVSADRITLRDLLARLSNQSAMPLTASEPLLDIELTVFADKSSLDAMMVSLADIFEGYWEFPKGSPTDGRTYCLVEFDPVVVPIGEWEAERNERLDQSIRDHLRPQIEARLREYREALSLTPDELLARHEKDDPWLCAILLNPGYRPVEQWLCQLSEADVDKLLTADAVAWRIGDLPADLVEHTRLWFEGRFGPGEAEGSAAPETWANGLMSFEWRPPWLGVQFRVPGVGGMNTGVLSPRDTYPPKRARQLLAQDGYRTATPQYLADAEEENNKWLAAHGMREGPPSLQQMRYDLAAPPDTARPGLERTVDLSSLRPLAPMRDVMALAAAQLDVCVVSHCLDPTTHQLYRQERKLPVGDSASLLQLLLAFRRGHRSWTWRMRGRQLALRDFDYRIRLADRWPEQLAAEWDSRLRAGSVIPLDDFAALAAGLTTSQRGQVEQILLETGEVDVGIGIWKLEAYGLLTATQRQALRSESGVRFEDLTGVQRRALLRVVSEQRPWLDEEALHGSALRGAVSSTTGGGTTLELSVTYSSPVAMTDRDVLFCLPTEITIKKDPTTHLMKSSESQTPPELGGKV